ncbi:TetR/AcrR family transcriptional regulator [Paenarthrobacter sp. NPDC090520]|uniref:TetR/AcrR family transcriptional regulator n=1 Tax=unclassified Paenarthrobacter TaxID=2634190 RepID=UPI0038233B9C
MDETSGLRERVRDLVLRTPGTQGNFAAAAAMDKTKFSKSLNGVRKFTASELGRIASHGGVSTDWLLYGRGEAASKRGPASDATAPGRAAVTMKNDAPHEKILVETWKLIAKHGYRGVRVSDVAHAVGSSPSLVIYYFSSRDELLNAAMRRHMEHSFVRQVDELRGISSPKDRILRLIELQLPLDDSSKEEWTSWIQVWSECVLEPRFRRMYWDAYRKWDGFIAQTIRLGQHQGIFNGGDPEGMTAQLTSMIDGLGIQALLGVPGRDVNDMRRQLHDFARRTLFA